MEEMEGRGDEVPLFASLEVPDRVPWTDSLASLNLFLGKWLGR